MSPCIRRGLARHFVGLLSGKPPYCGAAITTFDRNRPSFPATAGAAGAHPVQRAAAAWFISLLFTRWRHTDYKSKPSHRRPRLIIVVFDSHNSPSASLVIVLLSRCWRGLKVLPVGGGVDGKSGKEMTRSPRSKVKTVTVRKRKSLKIKLCIHAAELRSLRWHRIESSLLCKVKLDISTFVAAEGAQKC